MSSTFDDQKIDFEKYNSLFQQKIQNFKTGPNKQRKCTDTFCLVLFLAIFVAFVALTIIFLANGGKYLSEIADKIMTPDRDDLGSIFIKMIPKVVGMVFLSIGLSILFIILCSKFPQYIVYFFMIAAGAMFIILIIIGLVVKNFAIVIVFAISLGISLLIAYCYWEWIQIGISLLKISCNFLNQKPGIIFVSLMCLALNILFEVLWCLGYIAASSKTYTTYNSDADSRKTFSNLIYFYYALGFFFGLFLYYCLVYVVAIAVANWYYKQQSTHVLNGFLSLRYHLGSITFGAIIVTVIHMIRLLNSQGKKKGGGLAAAVLQCMIQCILSCLEELIKFLNHNAIIAMAMTGQDYIDSVKSAISMILQNFGLFVIVDFFTDFIGMYSMIVCVLGPSFLGGYLIYNSTGDSATGVLGGVLIFILALIVSFVILGLLYQILSCAFIFYCIDRKLQSRGIKVITMSQQSQQLFNNSFPSHYNNGQTNRRNTNQQKPYISNKNITTTNEQFSMQNFKR